MSVLRDHDTLKSKGFGFVKFHRAYHAALAFEECDRGEVNHRSFIAADKHDF